MIDAAPTYTDQHLADMFAALAHPARIRILRHLAGHSACNCKQVVGEVKLAQSTVSQHLKILVDAGLCATSRASSSRAIRSPHCRRSLEQFSRPIRRRMLRASHKEHAQWPVKQSPSKKA